VHGLCCCLLVEAFQSHVAAYNTVSVLHGFHSLCVTTRAMLHAAQLAASTAVVVGQRLPWLGMACVYAQHL